jgi:hypothetical protein
MPIDSSIASLEVNTVSAIDSRAFCSHRMALPQEWYTIATANIRPVSGNIRGNMVRLGHRRGNKGTYLVPISQVLPICEKYDSEKNYCSYATMLPGGQTDDHTFRPFRRVIDMDTPTVATEEQFAQISKAFPRALLLRTNGVQIFLKPSLPWAREAPLLAQIGQKVETMTGLKYDHLHVRKDGTAAATESHPFRAPIGYADRAGRAVLCFLPAIGQEEWTVVDAANALGIPVPPVCPGPGTAKSGVATKPSSQPTKIVSRLTKVKGGHVSNGEKNAEFSKIMAYRLKLMRGGMSEARAYEAIRAKAWTHHSTKDIERTIQKISTDPSYLPLSISRGGAGLIPDDEWDGIVRDQAATATRIGPRSRKGKKSQKTHQVYVERAWSFEYLFKFARVYKWNDNQAVEAFFNWTDFEQIRTISLSNLGRPRLEKDLRRCWTKFLNYKQRVADPELIEIVRKVILSLKTEVFKRARIAKLVPQVGSTRHLQTILGLLRNEGMIALEGQKRGCTWKIVIQSSPNTAGRKN